MEQKIREYEKFIEREVKKGKGSVEFFRLHTETVRNFQHERLVHLIIMLFFVFITVCLLFGTILGLFSGELYGGLFAAVGVLDVIMSALSIAYVRHYYFLENHIQGLYKYFSLIL